MSQPAARMDLLYTKLHPPPVRGKQVARPRLLARLEAALGQRLTLVCAPAGYGKTTLLSQWVERRAEPTGWVSLDRSDNDLAQFLRYFLAALQRVEPQLGALIPEWAPAPQPLPLPAVWLPLVNAIAAAEAPFVVVLDDYQEVEAQQVHQALDYLIERLPGNLHLILASRADPPLALPRLRARGHLTEIRLSDLRFSAAESAEFLNHIMQLGLSAQDLAALETRAEGWIASLQMAAIALRSQLSYQVDSPDLAARSQYIQAFTGSHRFILDYLVEEVLQHQPPAVQDFLLQTSLLERLSGALCDALLSDALLGEEEAGELPRAAGLPGAGSTGPGSQAILEQLETANLFIVPLDDERRWYRYHRLFADLLRKRLWQIYPERLPVLHRRASHWYERAGFFDEAIQHALAGEAFERAAGLIEANLEATLMRSEVRTLLNWLEKLPEADRRKRPRLAFYYAWALLMGGAALPVVEQRLRDVPGLQEADEGGGSMAGRVAALRAYLALFQADLNRSARLCLQALEQLPQGDQFLRNMVTWMLSMARLTDGRSQDGRQALDQVIRMSQETGNPLIAVTALAHQARLHMRQGCLQLAHETLQQALHLAADAQGRRLPIASEALIGLGELEREWNHLELAAQHLTDSIALAQQWNELASFDAYFPLMRLRLAQGDLDAARQALATALQIAHGSDLSQVDDYLAGLQQAYFFVTQGELGQVMRWAEQRGVLPGDAPEARPATDERQAYIDTHLRKYEQLVLARAWIGAGQAAEALALLESLLDQARQMERTDLAIEIHSLRALAWQQAGQDDQASQALAEALVLAEPGGYVRIFLDEGEPMTRLLQRAARRGLAPGYVAKLLAACGEPIPPPAGLITAGPQAQALSEPLSERELEVLRLLAGGLSNPEIASELVIAVSTIRTHCKNIYGKLGVHRRWDAVQRAQALGLI